MTMNCVPVGGEDDGDEACANCGKHGSVSVKLKSCTACRLVKYCGVDCQRAHRNQHKKACKAREAELKDEQLYSQGHERPEDDFCPICTLPIPLPIDKHSFSNRCCMKRVCDGCNYVAEKRGMHDCPFCRTPYPENDADALAMIRARAEKKDPEAINDLGDSYFHELYGFQEDVQRAVELYTEAAELGSLNALYNLGNAYRLGKGVQKDEAKAVELCGKAAMQGHAPSRHELGCDEGEKGNHGRAVKHFLISATMGDKLSLENINKAFLGGHATKGQYAQALRGYKAALEETKSPDREMARGSLADLRVQMQRERSTKTPSKK